MQLSSGYWHGCTIWTYDDVPLRQLQPEAPKPAWSINPARVISLSPPGNMECWGDNKEAKATPPRAISRATQSGRMVTFSAPNWYQVSSGATFTWRVRRQPNYR